MNLALHEFFCMPNRCCWWGRVARAKPVCVRLYLPIILHGTHVAWAPQVSIVHEWIVLLICACACVLSCLLLSDCVGERRHSVQTCGHHNSILIYQLYDWIVDAHLSHFKSVVDVEHSHVRFLGNLGKLFTLFQWWHHTEVIEVCYLYALLSFFSIFFLWITVLNLWDCGGQESFMEQYFASQKDNIFRNVEVLIYVFDVESRELDNDMHYYQSCLEAIYKVLMKQQFID